MYYKVHVYVTYFKGDDALLLLLSSLISVLIIHHFSSRTKEDNCFYGSDEMANAYNEAFLSNENVLQKTKN